MTTFAENTNGTAPEDMQIVPLAQYEYLDLTSQSIQSFSAGFQIKGTDIQFVGLYTQHVFDEPLLFDFPKRYHTIDILLDGKQDRHQYVAIFKSESDKPVSGGINTYEGALAYGYEMIHDSNLSLVLGGGLAVGNFGIETSDGDNWPIIPVPLVRVNYQSDLIDAKFEFLTSPNLSFTLWPKERIRLTGDVRMDQYRDLRDIIFECALEYRLFSEQETMGDFAGLSIGFKNDSYGAFQLGDEEDEESLEVHYYSIFATVDVSLLKISAGYAFEGRSLYREEQEENLGGGFYISVLGVIPF
jgi:hypothetical protein